VPPALVFNRLHVVFAVPSEECGAARIRQAVELRYAEDYSTAQVAQQLGIPLSAAKGGLMSARRAVPRITRARRSEPLRFGSGKTVHNHTSATMVDKVSCITGQVR
jgi:Sigma-70, region 4